MATGKRSREANAARVAVVGCGGWTQGWHLPNLDNRTDAVIAALVDPAEQPGIAGCIPSKCESMDALAEKYGAPRYSSVEALLADAKKLKLDGLLCAAPHRAHAAIGSLALKAGLHVLMEKVRCSLRASHTLSPRTLSPRTLSRRSLSSLLGPNTERIHMSSLSVHSQ